MKLRGGGCGGEDAAARLRRRLTQPVGAGASTQTGDASLLITLQAVLAGLLVACAHQSMWESKRAERGKGADVYGQA